MIILDTHIWLWLAEGSPRLAKSPILKAIRSAARKDEVLVPAICPWEIAMLVRKERIQLLKSAGEWINEALSMPGLNFLAMTPDIILDSVNLPGTFHGDPADRMIVASARAVEGRLATMDKNILAYGKKGYVRTV